MAKLPGCDEPHADLISVEQAREHIAALITPVTESEHVELREP